MRQGSSLRTVAGHLGGSGWATQAPETQATFKFTPRRMCGFLPLPSFHIVQECVQMYEAARAHVCTRVPMRVEARGFLSR